MSREIKKPPITPPARGPSGPCSPNFQPSANPPPPPDLLLDAEETSYYAMNTTSDLITGYRRFRSSIYSRQHSIYRELGYGSQNPQVMLVSCADSRADPSTIFDAGPGQLFVVRNIANLVHPYAPGKASHFDAVSAGLEYAVKSLKVAHIVIMGHGGCGGIAASLESDLGVPCVCDGAGFEFVGPWVAILKEARDRVRASGSFNPQYALELMGIEVSLKNLLTFPFVREAVEAGTLELHGAWFAIHHGELHWRNNYTGRFEVVPTKQADHNEASTADTSGLRSNSKSEPSLLSTHTLGD